MNKVKIPKITWKYIGDKSPERKKEAERRLADAYNILFKIAAENLRNKKNK